VIHDQNTYRDKERIEEETEEKREKRRNQEIGNQGVRSSTIISIEFL